MSSVTSHLARRGVELASQMAEDGNPMPKHVKMSPFGIALIVLTVVIMTATLSLTKYTFGILQTLTALEDTTKSVALVTDPGKPKDATAPTDPAFIVLEQKPITSKMRTTIRHLHMEAGWTARWRGMWLAICYHLAHTILMGLVTGMVGGIPRSHQHILFLGSRSTIVGFVANVVASVFLARWAITWTHVVMTVPNSKPWFRRIPSWKAWSKIALPTAGVAVVRHLSIKLPAFFVFPVASSAHEHVAATGFQILGIMVLHFSMVVGLVLPAELALTRMQASFLPEDAEPIIPFDASFGGRVVPEALGGKGYLSFMDSLRTLNREARLRYLKMAIKTTLVFFALTMCFSFIVAGEVSIFAWDAVKELQKNVHESL